MEHKSSRAAMSVAAYATAPLTFQKLNSDLVLDTKEQDVKVIVGEKEITVHFVQVSPQTNGNARKSLTVLFLHGGKYSSKNWVEIDTLRNVANWGHTAIAVDLPGKGKSQEAIEHAQYADFLSAFIAKMEITNLVLVAPSSSGRYAMPYLFQDPEKSTTKAVGFIPIAPGATQDYKELYKRSQVETLILYGTADPAGVPTLEDLNNLPRHQVAAIEGAGHACYLDDPAAFHNVLRQFLSQLAS